MMLRELLPETPVVHLARCLRRSTESVLAQLEAMAAPRKRGRFDRDDDDYLRRGYGALEVRVLAMLMGRTQVEVRTRAQELRQRRLRRGWTRDETARLKRWYPTRRERDLEVCLSRSAVDIRKKATEFGLGRDKIVAAARGEPPARMPRWAPAEIEQLRKIYSRMSNTDIARQLGRSVTSVASQARRLGLQKSGKTRSKLARRSVAMRRDR